MNRMRIATSAALAAASPFLFTVVSPLVGCGGANGNTASQLAQPPAYEPANQAKCGVKKSVEHPLVVEWPSADRATLEAKAQSGLVAVRYVGCEMEVLHRCKVTGKYAFTSITPKQERVVIKDADELYATLPVGAAKLEGKLAKAGQLSVSMTIVGRWEADKSEFADTDLQGSDCSRATHVVSGMTAGAFEFFAGADASVGGEASVAGAGGGARSSASRETLERDGRPEGCATKRGQSGPPDDCGAVLRLDVVPVHAPQAQTAATGGTAPVNPPPQGAAKGGASELHVAVTCGSSAEVMTPSSGLQVFVDGHAEAARATEVNFQSPQGYLMSDPSTAVPVGAPVDVAFPLDPGTHALRVAAPGCRALESSVDVRPDVGAHVEGDLPIDSAWSGGTSGAPMGGAFVIGGYLWPYPIRSSVGGTYGSGGSTVSQVSGPYGLWFGGEGVGRFTKFAWDLQMGFGSISGTTKDGSGTTTPFDSGTMMFASDLRFGGRLPLGYVALSAGAGVGGGFWIAESGASSLSAPGWFVPLWGSIDAKPSCDWGVSGGASYNWDPTYAPMNSTMFWLGLLWQPSPACARTPGLRAGKT